MSKAHELISRRPFDLYQLHLFRLVAESGSFTRAAQISGLTQSAITRQIQSIEQQLDLSLLTRTTRSVVTTPAGKFLLQESAPVLGDVDVLLRDSGRICKCAKGGAGGSFPERKPGLSSRFFLGQRATRTNRSFAGHP